MAEATRTVTVGSKVGLHARPASLFTTAAAASGHQVTIAKAGGTPVDARSILSVMSLGVAGGEELTLAVSGDEAERVLQELGDMLESDLDAKE